MVPGMKRADALGFEGMSRSLSGQEDAKELAQGQRQIVLQSEEGDWEGEGQAGGCGSREEEGRGCCGYCLKVPRELAAVILGGDRGTGAGPCGRGLGSAKV